MPAIKCLVLGGGFLGSNLARRLAKDGTYDVRVFGRRPLFHELLDGIDWYEGELSDQTLLKKALQSCDLVFHLIHGGTPQASNANLSDDIGQYLVPSVRLFELCRESNVRRVVFVSSGGSVYGPAAQTPTPETAPTQPITVYGISKLAAEKYLALCHHLSGLEYRILRVTNPFGPFQLPLKNQGIVGAVVSRALRNEPIQIWGDGTAVRDFIFVDDVIEALVKVADDPGPVRLFNIGSGQGRTVHDVIRATETLLGRLVRVEWKPGRPSDLPVSVIDASLAKKQLGWEPKTSFEDGLRTTIAWWQAHSALIDRLINSRR